MQDFAFAMTEALKADVTDPETGKIKVRRDEFGKPVDAQALTALMKAWESAQHRIAFHRRVPSPGSLKPEAKRKPKRGPSVGGSLARIMPLPQATDQGAAAEDQQPSVDPDATTPQGADANELPPAADASA